MKTSEKNIKTQQGWNKSLFVTLREEHRIRMFKNRLPIKICGSKRDKVRGDWRKLHNEELHDYIPCQLLFGYQSRKLRWTGLATYVEEAKSIQGLLGKHKGRRPSGGCRCTWDNNIKTDLNSIMM